MYDNFDHIGFDTHHVVTLKTHRLRRYMSKSPTKQLADSNSPTKLANNFYPFESEFENKIFLPGEIRDLIYSREY